MNMNLNNNLIKKIYHLKIKLLCGLNFYGIFFTDNLKNKVTLERNIDKV